MHPPPSGRVSIAPSASGVWPARVSVPPRPPPQSLRSLRASQPGAPLSSPPLSQAPASNGREVRIEQWLSRTFFVAPCAFRVDLPLDLSGCIVAALKEVREGIYRRSPSGVILASDARRGGAIFIEVETPWQVTHDRTITTIEGDMLTRSLAASATGGAALRTEVDELVRWSSELGREIGGFYMAFTEGTRPRTFLPTRLVAQLDGDEAEEELAISVPRKRSAQR